MHACTNTSIHLCIYIHTNKHSYTHTRVYTSIRTGIQTCTHTRICQVDVHAARFSHLSLVTVHWKLYLHAARVYWDLRRALEAGLELPHHLMYVHTCIHAACLHNTHISTRTHICMHTYLHTCMHVFTDVCMYIVHACVSIHPYIYVCTYLYI